MSDFYNKYPYTDFHELNLDWVIERVKKLTEDWLATHEEWVGVQQDWADTEQAWVDFKAYVENYLANLDVQDEIDHKINAMIADGSFETIIRPAVISQTVSTTTEWLAEHITQPTTPVIDTSLSIPGAAADAAQTGIEFNKVKNIFNRQFKWNGKNLFTYWYMHENVSINSSGVDATSVGTQSTDYLPYFEGNTAYICSTNGTGTYPLVVAFYDSAKSFISRIVSPNTGSFTTPLNTAFVRVSSNNLLSFPDKMQIEKGNIITSYEPYYALDETDLSDIEKAYVNYFNTKISNVEKYGNACFVDQTFTEDITLVFDHSDIPNADGTTGSYGDTWKSTDYIACDTYDYLKIKSSQFNDMGVALASIAFYDDNHTFISSIYPASTVREGYYEDVVYVPYNAAYFRMIRLTTNGGGEFAKYKKTSALTDYLNGLYNAQFIDYEKYPCNVLFIGDSLTEGDYGSYPPGTPNVKPYNYPYYYGKITGAQIYNHGKSGYTTKQWYANEYSNIDTSIDYDFCYIFLGTNGGIGYTAIDPNDEEKAAYKNILDDLISQYPNMHIIIMGIPWSDGRSANFMNTTNANLQAIAAEYNLPFFDTYNNSGMDSTNYLIYKPIDGIHYGKLGYNKLARWVVNNTVEQIHDNLNLYK